jgi:branched-chain amino acid transport system substrate-binding protein
LVSNERRRRNGEHACAGQNDGAGTASTPAQGRLGEHGMLTRRNMMAGTAALAAAPRARAQATPTIRIGMLQDASGANSILGGRLSLECARQAILDQQGTTGIKVDLIAADHRNSPDLGMSIARQWISSGVDAIMEFNNSAVALGVNTLIRDTDRVMLANNVGAAALSGKACTPNETHWTFDTAMLARVVGNALCDQGGDTWFFIRADYVFGRELRDDTAAVVRSRGGKVLGESALPLGSTDYASALLEAQSSGAKVVALALAGSDLQNCVKQAGEFGLMRGQQKVAALVMYPQYVQSLGLQAVQHTFLTESFYWDLNDRTRALTARVQPRTSGMPPHMGAAGAYSAVRHYLKAVAALGPAEAKLSGRTAVARMKQIPIEDDVLTNASIREDGRVVSDVYLFEVKTPAESKSEWDLYNLRATLGPDRGWRPLAEGGCPLVRG